jgi:hypothetical protein
MPMHASHILDADSTVMYQIWTVSDEVRAPPLPHRLPARRTKLDMQGTMCLE